MEIKFNQSHCYRLYEGSALKTSSGLVCMAQDLELNRNVCIKAVNISGNDSSQIEENFRCAMNEVKAMIAVGDSTPRVPNIYTSFFNREESKLYIVMQWIKGTSLREKKCVPEMQFIRWMMDLCSILSLMSKQRLYHKDIKPENIMINNENELFLIDFDISIASPNTTDGTPHYKAPEMSENSKYMSREKVDLFSIGVILYEYYTGSVPKRGIDYAKNSSRGEFKWDEFISPIDKNQRIIPLLNDIITKCMKLDPRERYQNANDLRNHLKTAERSLKNERGREFYIGKII